MSNALYGKGRAAFGNKKIDWVTDDIRAIIVDAADYSVDIDVDEFLSDVPAGARVATQALAGKSNALGVLDASDTVFTAVSGDVSEALVIYLHTGTEGTSHLIAYIDTATGLAVTPNGGDVTVQWDNGANKILKL